MVTLISVPQMERLSLKLYQRMAEFTGYFVGSAVMIKVGKDSKIKPLSDMDVKLMRTYICDHIAVFSGGTIKEYGDHDQLVNLKGGIYAEMFQAQAKYYAV